MIQGETHPINNIVVSKLDMSTLIYIMYMSYTMPSTVVSVFVCASSRLIIYKSQDCTNDSDYFNHVSHCIYLLTRICYILLMVP